MSAAVAPVAPAVSVPVKVYSSWWCH